MERKRLIQVGIGGWGLNWLDHSTTSDDFDLVAYVDVSREAFDAARERHGLDPQRFYEDLGFIIAWSSDDLAYVRHGSTSFLLQNFYEKNHAENFMMHLLVTDVEAWWSHVQSQGVESERS